jgi:hypothetical protein
VWLQYHPLHDCPKRNELLQLRHGRNARKRPDPILLVDLLLHRSPLSSRDGEEIRNWWRSAPPGLHWSGNFFFHLNSKTKGFTSFCRHMTEMHCICNSQHQLHNFFFKLCVLSFGRKGRAVHTSLASLPALPFACLSWKEGNQYEK